jgi:hypothetical protein
LDLLGNNYSVDSGKFNTYSGTKSNQGVEFSSPSSFGTLQTGTIDFFQVQPLPQSNLQMNIQTN